MAGASEKPPPVCKIALLHTFLGSLSFSRVQRTLQNQSSVPPGHPSPTDAGQSVSHILVHMFSLKDEILKFLNVSEQLLKLYLDRVQGVGRGWES